MPASNRFHMMSRMDRRIFLRELGGAGVTVLAGRTGSTATSGPPAPAASGPDRSRAALDRMHDRMAGYVERGEIPGIVALVTRGTMSTSTSSAHAHWRLAHPRPSGAPFNLKIVRGAA